MRTYMTLVLVAAPLLIDATVSRHFLEQAQHLVGELAGAMVIMAKSPTRATEMGARVDAAVTSMRAAAAPLTRTLTPDQ
jgi:hypothetical protein